jgi:hypothetical protein
MANGKCEARRLVRRVSDGEDEKNRVVKKSETNVFNQEVYGGAAHRNDNLGVTRYRRSRINPFLAASGQSPSEALQTFC